VTTLRRRPAPTGQLDERRTIEEAAQRFGVEPNISALTRINRFLDILELWNRRVRLTGERDRPTIVRRHVVDSIALVPHLPPHGLLIDVGSGAGFPGILLGCFRTDLSIVLLEARRKRVTFLREAIRATGLENIRALELRAEAGARDTSLAGRATIVTARAVRLDIFLPIASRLLAPDAVAIVMQTPRTESHAESVATAHGFVVRQRVEYALPDGTPRLLLMLARKTSSPVP
jgi:16S rRNA (guanine527-N7)-methyltransferase